MARYVAEGAGVTLVTCTAGEMGEILVPDLVHLAADQEDRLGEHRKGEIADAMKVLGVTDHRWLGGFQNYRDSGMKWHEDGYAIPADCHSRQRVLVRRPHQGRRRPGRGDPRGPAPGAGHLRPVRRLRPPRPHPGPPGGDVRRAAGRRPVLRPRPGRAVGDREDLLGRDVGEPDAGRPALAARGGRHHLVRGDGPRRSAAAVRDLGRQPLRLGRRLGLPRAEDGGAPLPTRRRSPSTALSSRSPTTRATRCGARSSSGSSRASSASSAPDGLESDLFAGIEP